MSTQTFISTGVPISEVNDEVSISGTLMSVIEDIIRKRMELKRQKGWIMETYILRQKDET